MAEEGSSKKYFVRDATGLVREISGWGALILSITIIAYNLGGAMVLTDAPYLFPGGNFVLGFVLAAIPLLLYGLLLSQVSTAMPRSGATYVLVSRAIHPYVGFITSFLYVIYILWAMGYWCSAIWTWGLSNMVSGMGLALNNPGLLSWGNTMATSTGLIIIFAIIFQLVITGLLLLRTRGYIKAIGVLLAIGFLSFVVNIAMIGLSSHAGFVAAWNAKLGSFINFNDVLSQAAAQGIPEATFSFNATLGVASLAFWSYVGFEFMPMMSGEVKNVKKSMPLAIFGALIISAIVYVISLSIVERVIGYDFLQSIGFLFYEHPELYIVPAQPFLQFFGMLLTNNLLIMAFIGIGFLIFTIGALSGDEICMVRIMFSWAFDRLFPDWIADVDEKGRPVKAVILMTIIVIGGAIWYVLTPLAFAMNLVMVICIFYFFLGISGMLFPFRMKSAYEATGFNKYVTFILGLITAILFGLMAYITGITSTEIVQVLIVGIVGTIIYAAFWLYRKNRGIDISLVFKEIPPE